MFKTSAEVRRQLSSRTIETLETPQTPKNTELWCIMRMDHVYRARPSPAQLRTPPLRPPLHVGLYASGFAPACACCSFICSTWITLCRLSCFRSIVFCSVSRFLATKSALSE